MGSGVESFYKKIIYIMKGKPKVAVFDFDGTLTTGDTFLPFLSHSFGVRKTFLGFIYSSPFIVAYLMRLVSNEYAKSKMINSDSVNR